MSQIKKDPMHDGLVLAEERASLEAAIDAYEAVRRTPGPQRLAAELAIKPWLDLVGVAEHRGRVYRWCHIEDSLIRNIPRRYGPDTPAARLVVDEVSFRRKGWHIDADKNEGHASDFHSLWTRCIRGRAI